MEYHLHTHLPCTQ